MVVVTFKISSSLFLGFEVKLNPLRFHTISDIVETVRDCLIDFLDLYKLEILVQRARDMNLHIHDFVSVNELANVSTVYVCDHVSSSATR